MKPVILICSILAVFATTNVQGTTSTEPILSTEGQAATTTTTTVSASSSGISDVTGDDNSNATTTTAATPVVATSTPSPSPPGPQGDFSDLDTVDYIIIGVTCGFVTMVIIGITVIVIRNRNRKKKSKDDVGSLVSREEFHTDVGHGKH